jgi:hypothetical protein
VFEQHIEAVKYNSLGQISHALYEVGEYRRNVRMDRFSATGRRSRVCRIKSRPNFIFSTDGLVSLVETSIQL